MKDELDHSEENFAEIIQILLSKKSDLVKIPDPDTNWPTDRIRIHSKETIRQLLSEYLSLRHTVLA